MRASLIAIFSIDKLPEAEQAAMIDRIGATVLESVLMRIMPTFSEADVKEYEQVVNQGDADAIINFFFTKVPNFMELVIEEANKYHEQASDLMSQI